MVKDKKAYLKQWWKNHPGKSKEYYLTYSCKPEHKESRHRYYMEHKEKVIAWRKAHPKISHDHCLNYRERRREFLNTLKNKPCLDCNQSFPPECMDFDHVRGEKVLGIYQMYTRKMSLLLEEIEKCDLVCSNCHRIRTASRKRPEWERIRGNKREGEGRE